MEFEVRYYDLEGDWEDANGFSTRKDAEENAEAWVLENPYKTAEVWQKERLSSIGASVKIKKSK